MKLRRCIIGLIVFLLQSRVGWAYPSVEKTTLDLGLNTATAMRIDADRQRLYVISNGALEVVDLATFAMASATPFDLSSDEDLEGSLRGMAMKPGVDHLYATQDGGSLIVYDLDDLAAEPTEIVIATGKDLTMVEYDSNADELLILDTTDNAILRYSFASEAVVATVSLLVSGQTVTIDSMHFVPSVANSSGTLYLTTTTGRLLIMPSQSTAVATLVLDALGTDDLAGVSALPDSSIIYVVNKTDTLLHKIQTASNTVLGTIDLSENSDPQFIAVSDVTTPSGTYGFVVGTDGLSVFDTDTDDVFDLDDTSSTDNEPLAISGTGPLVASDDGYLYLSFGKIAVITDHPFVTIPSVTYSNGGSSMGSGEAVTITFQADETGTYELRVGGDTTQNGTLLTDSAGATSGSVSSADTNQSVTVNYDDHASVFDEGSNTVFVFVTDSDGNVGRRATTVTVDTPPSTVTINSVGFGNEKIYVNLERLTASDISTYRVYADTDPAAVATKSDTAGTVAQAADGSTITVEATGLTNGLTYYVAAEAVDSAGNVSAARTTTLADGSAASALPEATVGPAGLSGEAGCTLIPHGNF